MTDDFIKRTSGLLSNIAKRFHLQSIRFEPYKMLQKPEEALAFISLLEEEIYAQNGLGTCLRIQIQAGLLICVTCCQEGRTQDLTRLTVSDVLCGKPGP